MESDDSDFEAPTNNLRLPCQNQSRRGVRGKGKDWREVTTCSCESQLMNWLAEDTGQWVKNKQPRTGEGLKQYMYCKSPGSLAELLVCYRSESTNASIMLHGDHCHGEEELKTRGLSESTKRWVLGSDDL